MAYFEEDYLMHYGKGHLDGGHSGRYPWGSGEVPYQHLGEFLKIVRERRGSDFTYVDKETGEVFTGDTAIAKSLGMSTDKYRTTYRIALHEEKSALYLQAKELRDQGLGWTEIGKIMGKSESSVRTLLQNQSGIEKNDAAKNTAEILKKMIDEQGMIEVGAGVELEMGISDRTLKEACAILKMSGYPVYGGRIDQVTNPSQKTTITVACPPGTEHKEIYENLDKINSYKPYMISYDEGVSYKPSFIFPPSLDSKRLEIKYADEGGLAKDGVIEIRPGVDDLSLGGSHYSQVRILVDGTHYLKGMAVYADDLPDGIDVRFNTNKGPETPIFGDKKKSILKPVKTITVDGVEEVDRENPFGSLIKEHGGQSFYDDPKGTFVDPITGKKQSQSLINKRADEGDWNDWQDKLPSQFLSKQSKELVHSQLKITLDDKKAEYDEIMSLTNPTIKRKMLEDFANDCDSSAVHLKAAALPRQKYQVILPLTSIKDTEVYAPNFTNGEQVALIRYPHGGRFEIPLLTVNNRNKEGAEVITKNAKDAVGISKAVADRLSGADFDGDTVMVIPVNDRVKIKNAPPLPGLATFDNKAEYPYRDGMKVMSKANTQKQMGVVSNLITDMTLKGAKNEELERAVKHSMVVIDANKHLLDYEKSYEDNNIAELKRKYQGHYDKDGNYHEGASTLISRAKSDASVDKRQGSGRINPDGSISYKTADDVEYTQVKVYKNVNEKTKATWVSAFEKDGSLQYYKSDSDREAKKTTKVTSDDEVKVKRRTTKSTKMAEAKDAFDLVSDADTPIEREYASYANKMKAYANEARKQAKFEVGRLEHTKEATQKYAKEVSSLNSKYNTAKKNAPRERQAQILANVDVDRKKALDPELEYNKSDLKKESQKSLTKARTSLGIPSRKDRQITITDSEWEAIQAGAISDSKLYEMLKYTDTDELRARATPRASRELSATKVQRIKSLSAKGYTNDEIASRLGISSSTVTKYIN